MTFEEWEGLRVSYRIGVIGGEPCIVGTRLTVANVAAMARRGLTLAEAAASYPYLTAFDLAYAERIAAPRARAAERLRLLEEVADKANDAMGGLSIGAAPHIFMAPVQDALAALRRFDGDNS